MTLPEPPIPLSLSVSKLTAKLNSAYQLSDVTLEVPAGGTLSIVGPVGAGKSALLWAANRLLEEVPGVEIRGQVRVAGIDVTKVPLTILRRRVGLLIAAPLARTPFAEIALPLRRFPAEHVGEKVEQALRLVGLWRDLRNCLHQPYNSNNPVFLRLLALARTMVLSPGLLLLDDPTRGLDSLGRARFEDAVAAIMATGRTTLVWATREPDQAGRVADTMAFLCSGQVVEVGPAEGIFERPADPRTESFLTGDYRALLSLVRDPSRQDNGRESE